MEQVCMGLDLETFGNGCASSEELRMILEDTNVSINNLIVVIDKHLVVDSQIGQWCLHDR